MKFIKVHDLNGNSVLVNFECVVAIKHCEGSTKLEFRNGMFGKAKETVEEIEDLINGKKD